ncbi:MAG: prepilin peptidase [Clostridiales bacterium]|nr:prepilin peptidase [Clostridiales bacterium]MBR6254180.1 prepilin peptidase [Clostridiales bacterium]
MGSDEVLAIVNIVLAGMFGAVIGSFTNVCIYRIPEHRTVVKGHSMCMTCGHELGALDLVPIFSWLFLGGKCRYCKTPISSRYIKIESLTAVMYMLMAATHLSMFLDPTVEDPMTNIFPFIELCALFIMINVVIVEMMIQHDTGSSMYRMSVALGIDFAVQLIARALGVATNDAISGELCSKLGSWGIEILTGAAIGLAAVILAVLFANRPKEMSKYLHDQKYRGVRTSDVFAIVLCACIGIIPAAVAATVYLIGRILIGNGKSVKYLGIVLASGAAVGYFANCAFQVI